MPGTLDPEHRFLVPSAEKISTAKYVRGTLIGDETPGHLCTVVVWVRCHYGVAIRCSSRMSRHDCDPYAMQYSILNLYGTNPTPNPEKRKMVGNEDEVCSI